MLTEAQRKALSAIYPAAIPLFVLLLLALVTPHQLETAADFLGRVTDTGRNGGFGFLLAAYMTIVFVSGVWLMRRLERGN